MLRMEIACILILTFISVIYFTASREKTKLHKIYSSILVVLLIHLIFDAITVVTVNQLDTFPRFWNDTFHRIFLSTMLLTLYLYYQYISELIKQEAGIEKYGKTYSTIKKVLNIYLVLAEIFLWVVPVEYEVTPKGNYEAGISATVLYVSVGVFLIHIFWDFIVNWKVIHPKKKTAIICAFSIEFVVTGLTYIDMSLLLAGMGLTLIAVSFYLVLENPDIKLVEQIREEKKRAEDANASKSAFLSVVSHEIRTPMNAIVGMTDLLLEENPTDNAKKYIKTIKTSGDSLLMIVNELLDQSKIEAGKMEIIEDVYERKQLLEDIRLIIENRIDTKPIDLIFEEEGEIPDRLVGDSLRIRQILINLLNNAVKFTEEGSITLKVSVVEKRENGLLLHYSVKDTGQGIREEDLHRLFEAFSQVDQKKNHSKEGTGLGLSISKDFIRLMGGELKVSSVYGEGTEFYFDLEQKFADENAKSKDEINREIDNVTINAEGKRILLVDDTAINFRIEKKMLDGTGIEVEWAGQGAKAIELVQQTKYDVIFMDYMMPYMDGVETTEHIRALADTEPDKDKANYYRNVPIIALTGDTLDESKVLFEKAGMNDYIEKPVTKRNLIKMLLKWLPQT